MYTLLSRIGWGSTIVEAALELSGQPYKLDPVESMEGEPDRDRLLAINPLGQLPTLLLPDGSVMTESAAIILHLSELAPQAGLAPAPGSANRAAFLRWLVFLVAAIYPTFVYGDVPARYLPDEAGQKAFRTSTDDQRKALWLQVEGTAGSPWFLGPEFSALDIYLWAMSHWRPGRAWFVEHCPRIVAIANAVDADPRLAAVKARNWSN